MKVWSKKLKIAIIERDMDKLEELSHDIPQTKDIELGNEALALMKQAMQIIEEEKENTREEMQKLKAARKYVD